MWACFFTELILICTNVFLNVPFSVIMFRMPVPFLGGLFSQEYKQIIIHSCCGNKWNKTCCKKFVHIFPRIASHLCRTPAECDCWCAVTDQGMTRYGFVIFTFITQGKSEQVYCCVNPHLFVFLLAVGSFNGVPSSIFKLEELETWDGARAFSVQHGPDLSPFLKRSQTRWMGERS